MIRRLLYLNGLAILGVVLFHSAGTGFTAMFAWAHQYLPAEAIAQDQVGSPAYLVLRALEQFGTFALSTLLFVSGYFIAVTIGNAPRPVQWKAVRGRLRSLLLPYLFWTVIILALIFLERREFPTLRRLFLAFFIGASNDVMYFIPLLMQYYLLAPLFVWFAKKNWKLFLGLSILLQLGVTLLPYPLFLSLDRGVLAGIDDLVPRWFFFSHILWVALGIVVGLHLDSFKQLIQRWRWVLLALAVALLPLCLIEWEFFFRVSGEAWLAYRETILDQLYNMAVIFSFLAFSENHLPLRKQFERLGGLSYAIFLTHYIFIIYTARIVYRLLPSVLGQQFILQPVLIGAGLFGPLALVMLMERTPLRRFYKVVFG